jgi:tRNA(Ile2) C34 agmatinyltransferase TiaS
MKCKYCGEENKSEDEDLLCKECREDFGHSLYSEL